MKRFNMAFTAAIVVGLAACNQAPTGGAPEDSGQGNASLASATDAHRTNEQNRSPTMTVTPVKTDNCSPHGYTTEISWFIPPGQMPSSGVEVRVNKADGDLLAYENAYKSTVRSGNWVLPGTTFYLVDRQSKNVITQVTSDGYDCR